MADDFKITCGVRMCEHLSDDADELTGYKYCTLNKIQISMTRECLNYKYVPDKYS